MIQCKMLMLSLIIFLKCVVLNAQINDTVSLKCKWNANQEYYIIKFYSNTSKKNKIGEVLYFKGKPVTDTLSYIYEECECDKPYLTVIDGKKKYVYDIFTKKTVLDFYFDSYDYYSNKYKFFTDKDKKYFGNICDSLIIEIDHVYDVQGVNDSLVFINTKTGTILYDLKNRYQKPYVHAKYYNALNCFCFQDSVCYMYDRNNLNFSTKLEFTNALSNVYSRYWVVKRGDKFGLIDHLDNSFDENTFKRVNSGLSAPKYKLVVGYQFDTLYRFSYPALISKNQNKYGLIYADQEILKPIYDSIYEQGAFYIYTSNINGVNKYGLVYNKTILTEPIFSKVINTYGYYYLVLDLSKNSSYVYAFNSLNKSNQKDITKEIVDIGKGDLSEKHYLSCYKMQHYINSFEESFYFLNSPNIGDNKMYFINSMNELYYLVDGSKNIRSVKKKRGYTLISVEQLFDSEGMTITRTDASQSRSVKVAFKFSKNKKIYEDCFWYSNDTGFQK